ncbi:MAG TPA: TIGR00730 family Rossman fold protein, partial [Rugosimonospora sp.]|nr:TIGR00730 family Rossman fold protein [Rugosimonospora sp.]
MAAVCVFCASSTRVERRYLDLAREVGERLAAAGHSLVSGGGRVGMMGTLAAGARSGGAYTLGIIPDSLVRLEVADTLADELVTTADMAERKVAMMAKADAFLILPGGIGTLDEL